MSLDERARAVRCECELPGSFCSGVPGVLALMEGDRLAAEATVERCDQCCRFESDEAARDALVERGLADPMPSDLQSFAVHCLAVVRVKFPGIVAKTPQEAARRARDRFCWDTHQRLAEFADDFTGFVVDLDGDDNRAWRQEFDGGMKEVPSTPQSV